MRNLVFILASISHCQSRRSWRKEYECCNGYRLKIKSTGLYICEPICHPECGNGTCVGPNLCICKYGYREETPAFDTVCVPVCTHSCVHGKCIAPEICMCNSGYKLTDDRYTCEPVCNVPCAEGSYCYKPDQCLCLNGYKMISSDDKLTNVGKQYTNTCFDLFIFNLNFT